MVKFAYRSTALLTPTLIESIKRHVPESSEVIMRHTGEWAARCCSGKNLGRACAILLLLIPLTTAAIDRNSELVAFNTQSHKVHKLSCIWAERCTKNCISIKRAEAYSRGGVPCKVCGG